MTTMVHLISLSLCCDDGWQLSRPLLWVDAAATLVAIGFSKSRYYLDDDEMI